MYEHRRIASWNVSTLILGITTGTGPSRSLAFTSRRILETNWDHISGVNEMIVASDFEVCGRVSVKLIMMRVGEPFVAPIHRAAGETR